MSTSHPIALAASLVLAAPSLTAQVDFADAAPPLVTTAATAEEFHAPDEVRFSVTVRTQGDDLADARARNATLAGKAIAFLRDGKAEGRDIQTQYLNVSVQYRDRQQLNPQYFATQTISVKLTDVDEYEAVSQGLLELGVTGLNGPDFSYSGEDELRERARVAAVRKARAQAESLAGAAGQEIGAAYHISDVEVTAQPMLYAREAMSMDAAGAEAAVPGVAAGQVKVVARVTCSFTLLP